MAEIFIYREHRIEISPLGKGWRARIYPPDSNVTLAESPTMLEKSPKEAIVAKAKNIIDAHLKAKE